ncbi:hypothetical protein [Buttiauxella izardii]|uniref:hypothetical protein n=1 Tax=Buttiauxella izardii TaxID=82991 RepID=UPI003AB04963
MLLVCVEVSGLKNRCNSHNLAAVPVVHVFLTSLLLQSCRCYTHLGASQDSRAGF